MSRPGVGGLLLLMWMSSVSLAQEAPAADLAEEAELHFSLAVERYKVADYSGALEHLLASNRLAPNKNVQFNIARTYEKLEQFNQAYRHYADYLQVETDPAQRKVASESLARIAPKVALVDVPECNAAWQGDSIVRRGAVDLSVAVAVQDGLVTPVVRGAESKSVRQIAAEVRALAGRAKEGKLLPEEYTGGSFSISNLGMFDIDHFTAILNPPEAAILAVGSVQQVPIVEAGALAVGWRMKVTMTCDHRVIDGALGARFLQALRGYVELPALLVL